ncbi:MAG: NAD(P)-dependent oxidoreductase [Betaproteobacteria bacterium]|nr:NAD(P)-dependent oxidoreductase [Betaproteobacteria bacterium]
MNTQTGIVGVGNMGGGMAKRLLSLGWPVVVHDLDANKLSELNALGAQISANAAAVAQAADTVIVCVIDAAQIQQVFDGPQGLLAGLKAGQTVIMCPTIAPSDTEHFAQQLQAIGVHMVDAPMSGGPIRAGNGTMSLMLAAPEDVLAAQDALLQALSNQCVLISHRVGDGARVKLVNNLLAGINLVGACEAMVLAEKMGLSQDTALSLIERSSGQSWIATDRLRRVFANDTSIGSHMRLLAKDTRLAMASAEQVGFSGWLGADAAKAFAMACEQGMTDMDDSQMLAFIRQAKKT